MTSKGKEIYNTIKRSLGSSSFSVAGSSSSGGSLNGVRYLGGSASSKQWIHPPDILLNGRVEYSVKMLGVTEVSEPKGTHVIREAIHAIRFQLQVSRSVTGHSGAKLKKVDLQINVDGVTVVESKTKMVLHKYPLHRISFCADDKQDKRVFSFIAKTEGVQRHDCFVFLSEKLAEQITLTIGEAFDLAYQKFIEKNGRDLENQKQLIVLRKRIAELETENNELREKLLVALRNNKAGSEVPAPLIPTTPIPVAPPPGLAPTGHGAGAVAGSGARSVQEVIPPPLVPPPSTGRRHSAHNNNNNLSSSASSATANIMQEISDGGPNVGRKLENLPIDRMENIFDDEFDPRANEKKVKDEFGLDPFGEFFTTGTNGGDGTDGEHGDGRARAQAGAQQEPTAEQFEQMLSMVDKRLAEMRDGFATGCLAVGDTGDSARDFETPYSVPHSHHNQSTDTPAPGPSSTTSAMSNGHS